MWRLCFLGSLSAEREGETLTLAPRKYTALLAYLALHGERRFGRDELTALFWPDSDTEAGRAALRTALSTLRKTFGPDIFERSGSDTVRVCDAVFVTDAARFDSLLRQARRAASVPEQEIRLLEAAVALYSGPLLPGIYADWAVALRERFEAAYEGAVKRRDALQRIAQSEQEQQAAEESFRRKTDGPTLQRLPFYNSRFIGRLPEIDQLADLILRSDNGRPIRLLTLTGPGGIGKTRLATEVARRVAGRFTGAVCLLPLAALTAAEEIGTTLAEALQITPISGADPFEQALFRLGEMGPSLIVLDNLEQLVEAGAAKVVRTLLARLPQVVLVVTSRRLLGIEGEHEFLVPPLNSPDCQKLFVEHAQAARADFTGQDTDTLSALCDRLEGIPLAIELCAPWVRVLTEPQMLEHLETRFRLLTSRRQDIPSRHRSLHAALEWGCPTEPGLLRFFAALSVFRGGFTLAAAEAVGGPEALHHLAALREQSLILVENEVGTGQVRYRLLETIREFAGEKLSPEDGEAARRRSLAYYRRLASELAPHLAETDSMRYFAALEAETANFRASIEFGLTDTPKSLWLTYGLMEELRWFWGIRGHRMPLSVWRERACARREELPEPSRTWLALQYAVYCAPESDRERLLQEARDRFAEINDMQGVVSAWEALAALYGQIGRPAQMEKAFREAAEIRRAAGDRRGYGYTLANLAGALFALGRVGEARELWRECREISLALGDTGSIAVLDRAEAGALLGEGRIADALPLLKSAAATFRHKGERWQLMDTLEHLGRTRIRSGQNREAQADLEEALAIARQRGDAPRTETLLALLTLAQK